MMDDLSQGVHVCAAAADVAAHNQTCAALGWKI